MTTNYEVYTSNSIGTSCNWTCPAGYLWNRSTLDCSACPAGYISEHRESSKCTACPEGKISSAGSANCHDCAAGRYNAYAGESSCTDCPYETYSGSSGSINCTTCDLVGTFTAEYSNDTSGVGACSAATACVGCPGMSIHTPVCFLAGADGSWRLALVSCAVGKYNDENLNGCLDCATGKSSTKGSTSCQIW